MAASTAGAQTPTADPNQGLAPGDQLRIVVYRNAEMSCDCTIAGNGTIIHPLYREIQVIGVPLTTVEDRIRTFLTRYVQNPQFVIQPLVKIVVGGEVRTPNIYSVPPETTIAQAIAIAGGPTDRGLLNEVKVIRDRQEIKMDVSRPDSDAGVLQIRSGDQILIGRRGRSALEFIAPVTSTIAATAAILSLVLK
ncbi:MAG TPA: polysaccharide biosynthesis/export family protein [Gemmatimonadaceae bacterium]|nr:polysaccharide biosynthesis/export family protein [Gemmatimonadaceae bacterium]